MDVLGIAGSLRRDSDNKAVLRTAADLAPEGRTITIHDSGDVPLYNYDVVGAWVRADPGCPARRRYRKRRHR